VTRAAAWRRAGAVMVAVLLADQITKAVVRGAIDRGDSIDVLPFLDLVYVRNDGIAFGALGGSALVLVLVVGALIGIVVFFRRNAERPLAWLSTGLLLGGAIGNVIDRVLEGAVTDFLKIPHWPAFNVADTAITVGVLSLIFVLDEDRRR
jgi:signal peptidase II